MGPHRKMGIYVGYNSPSIIKYLELLTGDLFTARYADCIFDEDNFPALGGEHNHKCREIDWNVEGIQSMDPRTNESKLEVICKILQIIYHMHLLITKVLLNPMFPL
jgi:hypothetical protein